MVEQKLGCGDTALQGFINLPGTRETKTQQSTIGKQYRQNLQGMPISAEDSVYTLLQAAHLMTWLHLTLARAHEKVHVQEQQNGILDHFIQVNKTVNSLTPYVQFMRCRLYSQVSDNLPKKVQSFLRSQHVSKSISYRIHTPTGS